LGAQGDEETVGEGESDGEADGDGVVRHRTSMLSKAKEPARNSAMSSNRKRMPEATEPSTDKPPATVM
jgi:hypothetical protein